MSRSYLPKAAVGSLLLVGAGSSLDQPDTIGDSQHREYRSVDLPPTEDAAPSKLAQAIARSYVSSASRSYNEDLEEAQDTEMELDLDNYLLNQPTFATPLGLHALGSIPRTYLQHPDEELRRLYREVEQGILGRFSCVDDEAVDLDSVYLLVALANECFEVARESYIISAAENETNWFEKALTWSNRRFRRIFRVSDNTFEALVTKLELNPIFQSDGPRPQRPVRYQLATFLIRYGNGYSNAYNPHLLLSIGEGSVFNYCKRVVRALRMLGLHAVAWPNDERKAEIKAAMYQKTRLFDGCIGALDGSLIDMARKPKDQGDEYLSRKKRPCINVMAIVDHDCRVINLELGWPGSKNDAYIWSRSWVYEHRGAHFAEGEYLLADKGYPLSPYIMRPFSEVEMHDDIPRKRRFNKILSGARICVERAFGQLKTRFPSLQCMGVVSDINDLYRTVQALVALHNICIDFGDAVDGHEINNEGGNDVLNDERFEGHRLDDEDEFGGQELVEDGNGLLQAGRALRAHYLNMLQ